MGDHRAWPEKVAVICTLVIVCSGSVATVASRTWCLTYNNEECEHCEPQRKQCNTTDDGKAQHCYALWRNTTEKGFQWVHRGCWLPPADCASSICEGQLRENKDTDSVIFCCCSGDDCNNQVFYTPAPTTPMPEEKDTPIHFHPRQQVFTILMSLVPIFGIALVVVIIFWLWRRHKVTYHEQLPTQEPPLPASPEPLIGLKPIQIKEIRARGRFGKVYEATLLLESVAVKEFPIQEHHSWETEKEIYMLGQMNNHDNILRFIAAEKRGDNMNTVLWLITEFHERGSLYDYLKGNLVSWTELLRIAQSMTCGLSFLHEEVPANKLGEFKPAVAHRDFKSKNVLLKSDLTACLADFGLALKFEPGAKTGDTHGQVGTRRYMAPEVLEGAINFNLDAFLRIDMYACGLVLWELLQRCSAADGPVEDYRLPFEAEVGLHPTLEEMQDVVVHQKKRPIFKDTWGKHLGMRSLYETIEECWDQDAEARLSSCCVHERLLPMMSNSALTTSPLAPPCVIVPPLPVTSGIDLPPPQVSETELQHSSSPPAYSESPLSVDV